MKNLINSCKVILTLIASIIVFISTAQNPNLNYNKFKQLKEEMATPNVYRTASGAPGHAYYQNEADYVMNLTLNDQQQKLTGSETITYHNNSQDKLEYLWLQLDQNKRAQSSDSYKIQTGGIKSLNTRSIKNMEPEFEGGFNISSVTKKDGSKQAYTIHKTMMRINLDKPLLPGTSFTFNVDWWYNINNRMEIGGRSGYEYFEEDNNYLYTIAQFFPRMCVYNDTEGWQNKQFLGSGEFTLPFGDYDVKIAVPTDHVVAATGNLVNAKEILSEEQIKRLELAKKSAHSRKLIASKRFVFSSPQKLT